MFAKKYDIDVKKINEIANEIYTAKGTLIDNEARAVNALMKLENGVQVSRLSEIFENETKQSFKYYLNSFLESKYVAKVYEHFKKFKE